MFRNLDNTPIKFENVIFYSVDIRLIVCF